MGIMLQRLLLQRLKVQLQGLAPHAVTLQVQPSKLIEHGFKQGLKDGTRGLSKLSSQIERLSGLRSVSSEGLNQSAASKCLMKSLLQLETESSWGLRVPASGARRTVIDFLKQSPNAAKSGCPTQGLHYLLKKLFKGTTTESALQRSSILSLKPLSNPPFKPLLGFSANSSLTLSSLRLKPPFTLSGFSSNPPLTLSQPHALRKLHYTATSQSPQSLWKQPFTPTKYLFTATQHPFKPTKHLFSITKRAFSTKGRPSNPKADARRRLAEESVRKASAKSKNMLLYLFALTVAMVGATYSAVPLYRMFCQATGFGGTVQKKETVEEKIARHTTEKKAAPARQITVQFNADVADGMPWKFTPCQREVKVVPGQSTLAFYTAHNLSDKAITGVSTYNVSPMRAGIYFNKIQCFCFEEQRLRPGEKVDMPVFFYIDPEFAEDVKMKGINLLTLSYTFFKVEEDE